MNRGADIVCFANDWATDPTSKHHLMTRFQERQRVLWIEAAGMRRPNLSSGRDLKRIVSKVRSFSRPSRHVLPSLWAYSPPVLPFPGSALAEKVNARLYHWAVHREQHRLGLSADPWLWVYAPHVAPRLTGMRRQRLIYHCVDRWAAFDEYDAKVMLRCEEDLCRQADVVVASAEDLAEHCRQWSDNVHYVAHGVDHAHFARALDAGDLPADLAAIPGPRVGFFGLLHEWVDLPLIGRLADQLPYQFVLIGDGNQDLGALRARSNVHVLGRRPFTQLPDYCRGFDAAIVPFRMTELTKSVNPIKLREYAAAGLPIVSVGLPEVVRCGDIVRIANDDATWLEQLTAAVEEGGRAHWRHAQSARVLDQDWSAVAGRIAALIHEAPGRRRAP